MVYSDLFKTELVLVVCGIIVSFYLFVFNIVRRWPYTINRIFALIALMAALGNTAHLVIMLSPAGVPGTAVFRGYLALLMLEAQLSFQLIQIYPERRLKGRLLPVLLSGIPGIAVAVYSVMSVEIISSVEVSDFINIYTGKQALVYLVVISLYLVGGVAILAYKSLVIENRAMRREIRYMLLASGFTYSSMIALIYVWPVLNGFAFFRSNFIHVPQLIQMAIVQYAVYDLRTVDFRSFFWRMRSWILPFVLLAVPVGLGLYFGKDMMPRNMIIASGIAVVIFIYLFAGYRIMKPRLDSFFNREYLSLVETFKGYFEPVKQMDYYDSEEEMWRLYHRSTIFPFRDGLDIDNASFFLLNRKENNFTNVYSFGERNAPSTIGMESDLVRCLNIHGHVLDRSLLYTEEGFSGFKQAILGLFNEAGIELALPFMDQNGAVFGILLLGSLPGGKIHSRTELSALDVYRIHFQRQLASLITVEDVREDRIVEHDRMVVDTVKKRIIPEEIQQVPGIRISSFYINNSASGGDYFDAVLLSKDRLALFVADTSYSGVDSAILGLELFSVLHALKKKTVTPERVLNNMNWVVTSGRFTERYAPAVVAVFNSPDELVLADAAHNPVSVYMPEDDSFSIFEPTGIPLGVEKGHVYESRSMNLPVGAIGILYSDGFTSAINEKGESYSLERARGIIHRNKSGSPALITRKIYEDFSGHIGNKKQINDVTVIIFKIIEVPRKK